MQQGSLIRRHRKRGPDVWQFRWADRGPFGKRIYRRRVIGTVCQYPDADSARKSVAGLLTEINTNGVKRSALPMTIAEVCGIAAERAVRIEMGRHQFRSRDNERHALDRVWSGRSVQDRILAEARAGSSNCFGGTREMERSLSLHRSRRLGFREQTAPRSETHMGPSDLTQVHSSSCAARRDSETVWMAYVPAHILDSETVWMAYVPAHILDSAAKRRY